MLDLNDAGWALIFVVNTCMSAQTPLSISEVLDVKPVLYYSNFTES